MIRIQAFLSHRTSEFLSSNSGTLLWLPLPHSGKKKHLWGAGYIVGNKRTSPGGLLAFPRSRLELSDRKTSFEPDVHVPAVSAKDDTLLSSV